MFISSNWRGEPLRDYETIVRLIANTTTVRGLTVTCRLDRRRYPVGRKVSDKEIATLNLTPQSFPANGTASFDRAPRSASQLTVPRMPTRHCSTTARGAPAYGTTMVCVAEPTLWPHGLAATTLSA